MKTPLLTWSRLFPYLAFGVVFMLAAVLRIWRLGDFPSGLHQDEAWFAYNALLLLKQGVNIYGERWPLTVNMWGEFVPSIHSYLIVPFIAFLGVHVAAFRMAIVSMSLLCFLAASGLMWQLFHDRRIVFIFAVLFALSPWNIVMSRASSTVVVDTFIVLCFLNLLVGMFRWSAQVRNWQPSAGITLIGFLVAVYATSVAGYFTYFTSRLLLFPMGLGVIIWAWATFREKIPRPILAVAMLPLVLYLIFPFGVMLRTPYALGRFQETTVLNNTGVKIRLFEDIARSGQNNFPVLLTRVLYNKITLNVQAFLDQYVAFFSPNVLLTKTGPPARYFTPNGGAITLLEYLGLLLVLGGIVFLSKTFSTQKVTALLLLWWLALAPIPSALTVDDFPNLQRAVIMTPFWQMVAAIGLFWVFWTVLQSWPILRRWLTTEKEIAFIVVVLVFLSLPSIVPFWLGYVVHAKYKEAIYRSRAGEELAKWINVNAHDVPIVMEHAEADFLYPYLWAGESILDQTVTKTDPYFLTSREIHIGQRHFVRDLCASKILHDPKYTYYILFTLRGPCTETRDLKPIYEAKYDDGTNGFTVYRQYTPEENLARRVKSASANKTPRTGQ